MTFLPLVRYRCGLRGLSRPSVVPSGDPGPSGYADQLLTNITHCVRYTAIGLRAVVILGCDVRSFRTDFSFL